MPNIAIIGYNIFGIGGTTRSNLNLMHEFDHSEYQLIYYNYTEFNKRDVLSLKNKYPYTSKVDFRFFLELYNLEPKQSYDYIFVTREDFFPLAKILRKAYPQAILGKSKLVQLEPSALNEYLKQTTNYSLVLYSGESLVDLDLDKLKAVLESKLALSGYGLVFSPNQVKVLGYRSFYHELRLATGTAHEFQAGLLQATSDTKEVLIPLTIESPIEVRASLDFSKTSSVYATLLFIEGNYTNALKYYQSYLKDCDYGLEESLHSVANAILASVFSDQIDWLEPYLETWTQFYQNFAIYQFSLGHYLKKIGKKQAAQQAFREAKRLANSLNPIINEED